MNSVFPLCLRCGGCSAPGGEVLVTQRLPRGIPNKPSAKMRLLQLVWASFLLAAHAPAASVAAPLGEYFSPADADAYVEAAVRMLGDAESSLQDKDYAVRLLTALDNASVASGYKSSACSAAAAGVSSEDLEQIYHGISLATGVGGCAVAKTWRASEAVQATMEKMHDLWSLYHATLAAPHLGVDMKTGGVLDKVLDLVQADGSVRSHPGGSAEDSNAFMAAELLAVLVPAAQGDAKAIALRTVASLKEKILDTEPALVVQLNQAHGEKLAIKATKLKSMARHLLEASRTSRPKSMLAVYEALKAIEEYPKAPLPIQLVPSCPSVEELSAGKVSLLVTSLLGSPAKVKSASLSKLARADGSDALGVSDGSPLGTPNSEGTRALPAVEVAAGLYTAEFSIEMDGAEEGKLLAAKLPVAVGSTAVLAETRLSVSESKEIDGLTAAAAGYVLAPGETLPNDAHASALEGHHLQVGLSLAGGAAAAPHQVFVRFTHAVTGLDTFFVAAPKHSGGGGGEGGVGEFSVSISLGEESATFLQRSGAYGVAILVGGPLVSPPVLENLGAIDLDFPVVKARDWPIYARPLLHDTDVALGPLPEKHHTFRQPELRPPAAVSLLFTILVMAPLAGLAYGMRWGGANLGRLPKAGAGRAWCVAYQACMVSVVLLFATYWLALTMAYTLQVLSVLSLVTTFTGRKALQSLAVQEEGARGADSHAKVE